MTLRVQARDCSCVRDWALTHSAPATGDYDVQMMGATALSTAGIRSQAGELTAFLAMAAGLVDLSSTTATRSRRSRGCSADSELHSSSKHRHHRDVRTPCCPR